MGVGPEVLMMLLQAVIMQALLMTQIEDNMSNPIEQIKQLGKYYIIVEATSCECLSDDGDIGGTYAYGQVAFRDYAADTQIGLAGKLVFTDIDNCKLFIDFEEAQAKAQELQDGDPSGEYSVLTIVKNEVTLYTLEDNEEDDE
jgi:hypothetical protein